MAPLSSPARTSIGPLLVSAFVLVAGNSLLNTLVPVRATVEGFPDLSIGILGSSYYAGMLAGTLAAPGALGRVGFVRAFAMFVALATAAALAYPLHVGPVAWIALRALLGFTFAGIYGVIDSWLNAASTNLNRGRVYGLYQIVNFGASAVGQQLPRAADPHGFRLFAVSGILLVLSIVPLAFATGNGPAQPRTMRLNLVWLIRVTPIGAATSFIVGCANGAFFSLAPVYALQMGGSPAAVSSFMTATVLGSALLVWPVGHISDRYDRRRLVVGFAAVGVLCELVLASHAATTSGALAAIGFGIGASTMVLYTLGIAHANDRAGQDHVVEVSSGLLFLYCVGAIAAPTIASAVMIAFGPSALFGQNAALHFALVGFTLWRMLVRPETGPGPDRDP
jgi:MFS family permease